MTRAGLRVHGLALTLAALLVWGATSAVAQDLREATVVSIAADGPERAAVQMLVDEVRARTDILWPVRAGAPKSGPLIVVAQAPRVATLLPRALRGEWRRPRALPPEGFTVRTLTGRRGGRAVVVICGNDARGVLFGVGYLLRKLDTGPGEVGLARALARVTAPAQPIRANQIGYRFKNNSYDAWTRAMFEQRVRDFAMFGANTIQVISPFSDDERASPLFPAPPMETLIGLGKITHKYGLNFALYYPDLAEDYAKPGAVEAELAQFEALVRQSPQIDALYIPGGDPGHTRPDLLFPLVARQAEILRRYNPKAQVWISGQGFDQARYERFYALLAREPAWLTGVFFGPQSRDPLPVQRRRIPARYPLLFYPDTGHVMHAQFPVPQWDPAFALTEGREPIDPRPLAQTEIFRHFAPLNRGAVTYSEGVNDDVNALLWFQLGWSPRIDPHEVMGDYARTFLGSRIGPVSSERFAEGLFDLERNWVGPPQRNPGIDETLARFQAMEGSASPAQLANWRFESALYRAYYDAYVRARATAEDARQADALAALSEAPSLGSEAAMAGAAKALAQGDDAAILALRAHLFDLGRRLWEHARLQLSVPLYGASGVERGANLDRVDVSLNDRVWLTRQFAQIAALPSEAERRARLAEIVDWPDAREAALYDDLGDPEHEPHLVRGQGFARDPEFYDTAIDGVADMTPDDGWRRSWISYAETLYDHPMTLAYKGLDSTRSYRLRITYAGEGYHAPMRLVANGAIELQPLTDRPANPTTVELAVPRAATASGSLTLRWTGPLDGGGSGRGHQVAEVWLIPERADPEKVSNNAPTP